MKVKDLISDLQKCPLDAEVENFIVIATWFDENGWSHRECFSMYKDKDGEDD